MLIISAGLVRWTLEDQSELSPYRLSSLGAHGAQGQRFRALRYPANPAEQAVAHPWGCGFTRWALEDQSEVSPYRLSSLGAHGPRFAPSRQDCHAATGSEPTPRGCNRFFSLIFFKKNTFWAQGPTYPLGRLCGHRSGYCSY